MACPNHGFCDQCTGRHLRLGYLNYCGFRTILPTLEKAIQASPESETAKQLKALIETANKAYSALMEKHGLSPADQEEKVKKVSELSRS
jgi:hypothetical protein